MLMFGFGDADINDPASIDLLEQYLVEFVQNLALTSFKRSKKRGFSEIKHKDLLSVIKDNKKMFYRVPSILQFIKLHKSIKEDSSKPNKSKKKRLGPNHK